MGLESRNLRIYSAYKSNKSETRWLVREEHALSDWKSICHSLQPRKTRELSYTRLVSSRLVSSALRGPLRSSLCKTSKPSGFNSSPELLILPPRKKIVDILVRAVIE